ncbi:MAG: hypothetical protein NTY09_14645 [bacterium]|nr:hypothetical protein [bacterium]
MEDQEPKNLEELTREIEDRKLRIREFDRTFGKIQNVKIILYIIIFILIVLAFNSFNCLQQPRGLVL